MEDFLPFLWERRARLIGIWFVVMIAVALRLAAIDNLYTSSCLLTPLPLEHVEGPRPTSFGGTSVRSILAGGGERDDYTVAAFLRSRRLLDGVVDRLDLKRELFPNRWDEKAGRWIEERGGEPGAAATRRAMDPHVDVFYDEFTGLLSLDVHWWSPERAKEIAEAFVSVSDEMLRQAAIAEGERRVAELEKEMERAPVSDVRAYLAEELTRAISSLTSIRARARYAFRVIDPPVVPDRKSWPPRTLLLMLTGVVVAVIEVGLVLAAHLRRPRPSEPADANGPRADTH